MRVPVHGPILDSAEDEALQAVIKRRWLTYGPACQEFERKLEAFTGRREAILVNSGSSANLLALTCLTDATLGKRRIQPGDQIITASLGFPTTLNPILQIGAIPIFVDVDLPSMTPNMDQVYHAISHFTRGMIFAHPLGMPVDFKELRRLCDENDLWLVEDACDGFGSPGTNEVSDLSTLSFYPAHQITTGEGGAVLVDKPALAKIILSLRDWGRDCWCEPGKDDTCGSRFASNYDHKYSYSRIGYHLAMTEMQAALGVAQMDKLPGFVQKRNANHAYLYSKMVEAGMDEYFILPPNVEASWFGFALICKPPIKRLEITQYLEERGIQTRVMFGGNLRRQPAYKGKLPEDWQTFPMTNTDIVHENAFWVGCWPGLNEAHLDYIQNSVVEYCEGL